MKANHALRRVVVGSAVAAVLWSAVAWATTSSGTTSTLIGPMTSFDAFKVKRQSGLRKTRDTNPIGDEIGRTQRGDMADDWNLEIKAKDGLSIATQIITFAPGGQSGWHSHPGPVFISVKEGTMTFYDENCKATVLSAGQGFLDAGIDAHLARNESASPAINVVTYLTPRDAPALRIDAPQPLNCRL